MTALDGNPQRRANSIEEGISVTQTSRGWTIGKAVTLSIICLIVVAQICLETAAAASKNEYFAFAAAILFDPVLLGIAIYFLLFLAQRNRRLDWMFAGAVVCEALWYLFGMWRIS